MTFNAFDLAKLLHLIKEKPESDVRVNILAIVTYYGYTDNPGLLYHYNARFGFIKEQKLLDEVNNLVTERKLIRIIVGKRNTLYFNTGTDFEFI